MTALSINPDVRVVVNITPIASPRQNFNLGLVIGASTIINTTERVRLYTSVADMLTDGFSPVSAEYLAAVKYFSADSQPYQILIGRQGSGETPLTALTACLAKNQDWYLSYIPGASESESLACSAFVEALTDNKVQYMIQSNAAAVLNNTSGNLFATLKAELYKRTHAMYSTDAYAIAGVMGYAMGQTTQARDSYYTLKYKELPNVLPESLTATQVGNIEANNGNVYVTRGPKNTYEQGKQSSGQFFDEIIFSDMLANQIQLGCLDSLCALPAIPQTEEGVAILKNDCNVACDLLAQIGWIRPGVWKGPNLLNLKTGTYLPLGYQTLSESVDAQDQASRELRICPPIYVCVKEGGAMHSVLIEVNLNR